jgi:molecular chaperone HscB
MDPFATLGIARTFDIDVGALEKSHRKLSRAVHPDRHMAAGASEKRDALARAMEVNEAWRIVRDPIRRAEALLSLSGLRITEGREPKLGTEFLMWMLDQREALDEARRAHDLGAIRALGGTIRTRAAQVERDLSVGLARGPSESMMGKIGELRFYRRFLDEVSALEDEIAA